ncbi:putative type I restriction enzymeP M protein [Clostridium acetireducens DSM 10703]|uniref:site-specific DNA-methyltransferase (adenine-specific) n=1 Tax=Clostridium acetireducens DSM 10703 TaxID=1121290 RepID=A0A1E8EX45_9CLOT|nr:N-6 DNA methylase [Clostridium acetireducens]OFI05350.1 putative type I restriction enzymeP M protein [Clostridium acetireducens DSM 10703]
MKSLTLAHDIFRGEYVLDNWSKRKLIASISATKVILENKERLNVDINDDWTYASLNKENLISVLKEIELLTKLSCFNNSDGIEVLKTMKDSDFDKFINIINSSVNSNDIISYCKELRVTANVDGKMYDYTTKYGVLDVPVSIINPTIDNTIIDSFNGESGTEITIKEFLNLSDEYGYKLKYYGQEVNSESHAIGELINFLITGNKNRIVLGDSLINPAFTNDNNLIKYDIAISNPSFMMKIDKNTLSKDIYGRFKYGLTNNSDWVVVSHILSTIKDTGKAAVLLPIGALFRGGAEERIRKSIINEDLIEAVIRIPGSVLSYTNIVTCWVIFNKDKEEDRKGKIQFIDLTDYVESIDRRNNTISKEGVNDAVKAYKKMQENSISFFLGMKKIEEKQYDLNAFDYIKSEKLIESVSHINMTELCRVAQIRRGVQVNKGKLDALNTGSERTHYLISIGNIVDGKIVFEESNKIRIERKWEGVYEVKKGDLLVTSKGTQFKVALVDKDMKGIVSANLFIVRAYEDKYIPEVLKYYLESELGQSLVEGIIKGTAIKSISHKDIEKLSVPDIDIKVQEKVVKKIRKSNEEYNKRLEEAKRIYNEEQKDIKKALNLIN